MLYYNRIDISEGIELILLKLIEVKSICFVTIRFLIMDSNFKVLCAMVVMICQF